MLLTLNTVFHIIHICVGRREMSEPSWRGRGYSSRSTEGPQARRPHANPGMQAGRPHTVTPRALFLVGQHRTWLGRTPRRKGREATEGPACPRHRSGSVRPVLPRAALLAGSPAPRHGLPQAGPALLTWTGCGTSIYGPGAAMVHQLIHLTRRQADSPNRLLFPIPRPLGHQQVWHQDGRRACVRCAHAPPVCWGHCCTLLKGHREGVSTPGQRPAPSLCPRPSITVGTVSEGPLQIEKSAMPAAKTMESP